MLAVSDKVSDLIFSPGRPPQIELVGKLQPWKFRRRQAYSRADRGNRKLIIGNHEEASESLNNMGRQISLSASLRSAGFA
jgi:twitching motility protein PilT